jgi:hypothetical protein
MRVGILPAAPVFACRLRLGEPLPGSVKVARRPVKPFGVGASPTLAATFQTLNERKSYEARPPLPKPIVVPQELQTKSYHPNPPGEAEFFVSSGALRLETANQNL